MGSIRARKETGQLFFDFRYRGQRCREQTLLDDTPANRKRLEKALAKIEADIAAGSFDYAATFPTSRNAGVTAQTSPAAAAPQPLHIASPAAIAAAETANLRGSQPAEPRIWCRSQTVVGGFCVMN